MGLQSYDLILMDMQMPVMDGLEASRLIVERFAPEARPYIVAMTANAAGRHGKACAVAGMGLFPRQTGRSLISTSCWNGSA